MLDISINQWRLALVGLVFMYSLNSSGIPGLWHKSQLEDGLAFWQRSAPNKTSMNLIEDASGALVRIDSKCSGFFVSADGHILTSYSCILNSLEELHFQNKMHIEKGFVVSDKDSAPYLSPINQIYHQIQEMDVSLELLKGIDTVPLSKRFDTIKSRSKIIEDKCEKSSAKGVKCRIQAVNYGTQYSLIAEVPLKVKLVMAPSLKEGIQSRYIGLGTKGLKEGEKPVLLRAFVETPSGEKNYSPGSFFKLKDRKIGNGDPVWNISYANIYKRYIDRIGMEGNLNPKTDFLKSFYIFADELDKGWSEYFQRYPSRKYQYLKSAKYKSQWNYRLRVGNNPGKRAMEILKLDEVFQEEFSKFFSKHASKEEQDLYSRFLNGPASERVSQNADLLNYCMSLCLPSKILNKAKQNFEDMDFYELSERNHWLTLRREMLQPETSAICYDALYKGLQAMPELHKDLPQIPKKLLLATSKERRRILANMIDESSISKPTIVKSNFSENVWKDDDLYNMISQLEEHFGSFKGMNGSLVTYDQIMIVYYKYMSAYFRTKNSMYFPGMDKVSLPLYGFGQVTHLSKTGKGKVFRFATDIDTGFRNMRGSPTIDSDGQLVGMFWSTDYKKRPYLNFLYDKAEAYGIHISISEILNTIRSANLPATTLAKLGFDKKREAGSNSTVGASGKTKI